MGFFTSSSTGGIYHEIYMAGLHSDSVRIQLSHPAFKKRNCCHAHPIQASAENKAGCMANHLHVPNIHSISELTESKVKESVQKHQILRRRSMAICEKNTAIM